MGIKKEIQIIESRLNELKNSDCCFRDIFQSFFSEKDKVLFTQYSDGSTRDFTYGQIEKEIYSAKEAILSVTKGLNPGAWIAVNAENKVIWTIAFWATLMAGYKAFLLNPNHTKKINISNIKTLNIKYVVGDCEFDDLTMISLEDLKTSNEETDLSRFENEIALSSSGSSSTPKIAVYSGIKIFRNLENYLYVLHKNKIYIAHKGKQHSQLVILPFYHIFGLILVYMWYSFSHSRFVLPKDLTPSSIQPTLKKEKIDMILSVPLLFEKVTDKIYAVAKEQGKEQKLASLISFNNKIQEKLPHLGLWIIKNIAAKSLRKKTFGTSTSILGIGGAKISQKSLHTLNGLGYKAINGYGTTELSIFLAGYDCNTKELNSATIGKDPWRGEYRFEENGELSLRVPTCCDYVLENGQKRIINSNAFIPTGDIGHIENGCFFIDAREDDLLVMPNGEKVYPNAIESYFEFIGANQYRVLIYKQKLVLVVYQDKQTSKESLYKLYLKIKETNKTIPSALRVQEIRKTTTPLPLSLKQEVSRLALLELLNTHLEDYPFMSNSDSKISEQSLVDKDTLQYIKKEVASILGIKDLKTISESDDFFTDLGGDSLSFMELCSRLNGRGYFAADKALAMSATSIREIVIQYKTDSAVKGKEETYGIQSR